MALTQDVLSRVIAFANGKGGVGKTSTSANFAGLSAAAGWRTLFIEFDAQGDAGDDLGYKHSPDNDRGAHMLGVLDDHQRCALVIHAFVGAFVMADRDGAASRSAAQANHLWTVPQAPME